jgi:rod shape-determining protein MreC
MSRDRYSIGYANTNSRPLAQRVIAVILFIAAITLLILTRMHHPIVTHIRTTLIDAVSPAVDFISTPVSGIRTLIRNKDSLFHSLEENKQLRIEADNLRRWQAVAQALKAENDALRALAGYQPVDTASYITARVIGQSPSSYSATLMISSGTTQGIKNLQPVIDAYGMIGRIVEVGDHSARVLLLSDSASRIPVVTADTRVHAILVGNGAGDELMRMTFLGSESEKIAIGEQVVTTEEGGLIPGGIMIGTVFRRDAQGLFIKPLRPLAQSEYVRVVSVK